MAKELWKNILNDTKVLNSQKLCSSERKGVVEVITKEKWVEEMKVLNEYLNIEGTKEVLDERGSKVLNESIKWISEYIWIQKVNIQKKVCEKKTRNNLIEMSINVLEHNRWWKH